MCDSSRWFVGARSSGHPVARSRPVLRSAGGQKQVRMGTRPALGRNRSQRPDIWEKHCLFNAAEPHGKVRGPAWVARNLILGSPASSGAVARPNLRLLRTSGAFPPPHEVSSIELAPQMYSSLAHRTLQDHVWLELSMPMCPPACCLFMSKPMPPCTMCNVPCQDSSGNWVVQLWLRAAHAGACRPRRPH